MTPVKAAHRMTSLNILPVGFALILAVLAASATVTSDRLWSAETGEVAEILD